MGGLNSKCSVLTLNGQGGKTRRIQEMIKEEEAAALAATGTPAGARRINFVIQANNRSLVQQTTTRMDKDLYVSEEQLDADAKIEGNCFSWCSGNRGPKVTVDALAWMLMSGKVTMVVLCANRVRLDYLRKVIIEMEEAHLKRRIPYEKMNIWFDEADAYMSFLKDANFHDIVKKDIVEKVTLVTATVDAIVDYFGSIRVIPLENPTLPIYFRVQDSEVEFYPQRTQTAASFVKMVVDAKPELYKKAGVRVFAPGEREQKSHEEIAEFAISIGAAVIILNGLFKEIRMPSPDRRIIKLPSMRETEEEIGRSIGRLYAEHDLKRFPLFITGNLCLGRGITFQNNMFLFDHQIIPSSFIVRAVAYQAACRGAGNVKELPNFIARAATGFKPTIATTEKVWKLIVEAETIASTLPKKAFHTGSCIVRRQDLEIASGSDEGNLLQYSHVPVSFPLPDILRGIKGHPRGTWSKLVLDCLKERSPSVYADITANYEEKGHVNNYSLSEDGGNSKDGRYKSMFRPVYEAAKKNERARPPKFDEAISIAGKNIWYAALDHSSGPGHLVICRWEGRRMP
jgi:hypothetical protein